MFIGDIFDPFAKVKTHLKSKSDTIFTDNWIFLLHRKWSLVISLIALIIIFSYPAMIEQPIVCHGPSVDEVPKDFLDEWCWLAGTYNVPAHIDKPIGKSVVASGVGPDLFNAHGNGTTTERLYHNQYIFYPIMFLLQLSTFLASKHLWKHLEGGRLRHLLNELTCYIIDDETYKKRIDLVSDYISSSPSTLTFHNTYAYRYIFCELLNALNIILQFWAIDRMLHRHFLGYGWDAIAYLREPFGAKTVMDPFTKIFPKLAICHFIKVGPSGNAVPLEALCVLPLNNLADKIFLIWWFWLVILGFITTAGLMYRGVVMFSSCARYKVLRLKTYGTGCCTLDLKYFVDHASYGDWFVVSLMQKNMDGWIYSQLVQEIVVKMKEGKRKIL